MSSRYLTEHDRMIVSGCYLKLVYRNEEVQFQFPPVILSDSRGVNWNVTGVIAKDPVASIVDNSAREMSMRLEYIVEDDDPDTTTGPVWTIGKIKYQLNLLKGYFTGFDNMSPNSGIGGGTMTALFRHTSITGSQPKSVRIGRVNLSYSGPNIGNGFTSMPLKTIVTFDMSTVSSGFDRDYSNPDLHWTDLQPFPKFDELWY